MNRREQTAGHRLPRLLSWLGAWLPGRITVATSASLDHRVFFLLPVNPTKVELGDYLVFRHAGSLAGAAGTRTGQ